MPTRTTAAAVPPARTHKEALELFRRPFAPGAIGFRAMTKVPYGDDPWGGAKVAAYLGASATDAVGPVTISYSKASGATFAVGTTTVTETRRLGARPAPSRRAPSR